MLPSGQTRIQNANFGSKVGGATIIADMVRKEGLSSFFKGLTPKILVVGPKLVFSYTLAQSLIPFFGKFGEWRATILGGATRLSTFRWEVTDAGQRGLLQCNRIAM